MKQVNKDHNTGMGKRKRRNYVRKTRSARFNKSLQDQDSATEAERQQRRLGASSMQEAWLQPPALHIPQVPPEATPAHRAWRSPGAEPGVVKIHTHKKETISKEVQKEMNATAASSRNHI